VKTDIEAEPKTAGEIEADAETARAAQNPDPGAKRLFARRAKLQVQIARLTQKRRWISLGETINWLAAFNTQGFRGTIDNKAALSYAAELRDALCGGAFSRAIAGKSLPRVIILSDDQPAARFNSEDIDAVRKPKPGQRRKTAMYDDPPTLRTLIERLWVPRDLLLKLFQERQWPTPGWIETPRSQPEVSPLQDGYQIPESAAGGEQSEHARKTLWRKFPSGIIPKHHSMQQLANMVSSPAVGRDTVRRLLMPPK
jgi:hypothetical protein